MNHPLAPGDADQNAGRGLGKPDRRVIVEPALEAITNIVPTSQLMFGTDFPLVAIDDTANGLRSHGFASTDLQAIARGNALGLFPRLKG